MALDLLSNSEVTKQLESLPCWKHVDGKLRRELVFPTFLDAMAFMNKAAEISEKLNHHPNWSNVYTRVVIELWTHDAGGITKKDFAWAIATATLCEKAVAS